MAILCDSWSNNNSNNRIVRKYAYDNVKMDARVGWFYVMFGILISSLLGIIYYIITCPKLCKTLLTPNSINKYKDRYGNNMMYVMIISGMFFLMATFFIINQCI